MARILVIYYSASGNTRKMAELVAEGASAAGGHDVKTVPVEELSMTEFTAADGYAFGSPDYFTYMAGQDQGQAVRQLRDARGRGRRDSEPRQAGFGHRSEESVRRRQEPGRAGEGSDRGVEGVGGKAGQGRRLSRSTAKTHGKDVHIGKKPVPIHGDGLSSCHARGRLSPISARPCLCPRPNASCCYRPVQGGQWASSSPFLSGRSGHP